MANYARGGSVGGRIAAARKARGFRSTRDLAVALQGSGLTESVLENIELGRRSNIDVSHILNIARVLGVPPVALLAPIARPGDPVDLPNLGPAFDGMTAADFDAWFSSTSSSFDLAKSADERNDRAEIQALRELKELERELARLDAVSRLESENELPDPLRRATRARSDDLATRVDALVTFLRSAGWEV